MDSQQNKTAIVTGVSRGIGLALVNELLSRGYFVIGIGRQNPNLTNINFQFISADLSNQKEVENIEFNNLTGNQLVVIHNAGSIGEINLSGKVSQSGVYNTFNLNTVAPIILTNEIIYRFKNSFNTVNFIFISSGAAIRPISGWSIYCATKAALNHFCLTLIEDLKFQQLNHITAHAISPGVVDTEMQKEIREANVEQFPEHANFVQLHQEKKLREPNWIATKIFNLIKNSHEFEQGVIRIDDI